MFFKIRILQVVFASILFSIFMSGLANQSIAGKQLTDSSQAVKFGKGLQHEKNYLDGTRLYRKYVKIDDVHELESTKSGVLDLESMQLEVSAYLQSKISFVSPTIKLERGFACQSVDKSFVNNNLTYEGIPVAKGSDVLAIVGAGGRLTAIRKRNIPLSLNATEPTVGKQMAVGVGRKRFNSVYGNNTVEVSDVSLEVWVDHKQGGHLSWVYTLSSTSIDKPQAVRYWVSAIDTPEILFWESLIYDGHEGKVEGEAWEESPLKPKKNYPLAHMKVTRNGAGGGTITTETDGTYNFPSGTGQVRIGGDLQGKFSTINNAAGSIMERNTSGDDTSPINLFFNGSDEFEDAQVTAYYWTTLTHDFAQDILGNSLSLLPTRVNIDSSCNAYWNGSSINFFRSGGPCPNTAYSDVITHEYGHGIDASIGGILDGGYSEGFGDAMAILITRQSCLGRDFNGAGGCLRDATDVITWPPSSPEVHHVGRIYAGFTWELIQQLQNNYSEDESYAIAKKLILQAAAGNPSDIPDAVALSFLADDDDGDLSNGTPHCNELLEAAKSRTIPTPIDKCGGSSQQSCCAMGTSAQFSLTEKKQVSSNSNILVANIHLDHEMEVHITANTSTRSLVGPLFFRTGFYNGEAPNVMWTHSYRNVNIPEKNFLVNFGSSFSTRLMPGDHKIYWKIWVGGGTLEFSSGTMLIEAFDPTSFSLIPEEEETMTAPIERGKTSFDEAGYDIIRIE